MSPSKDVQSSSIAKIVEKLNYVPGMRRSQRKQKFQLLGLGGLKLLHGNILQGFDKNFAFITMMNSTALSTRQ
jgi:hypothetical protein